MVVRRKRKVMYGPPCPLDEEHGGLLDVLDWDGNLVWYCPHSGHLKPGAHTQYVFSDTEATRSQMLYDGVLTAAA